MHIDDVPSYGKKENARRTDGSNPCVKLLVEDVVEINGVTKSVISRNISVDVPLEFVKAAERRAENANRKSGLWYAGKI